MLDASKRHIVLSYRSCDAPEGVGSLPLITCAGSIVGLLSAMYACAPVAGVFVILGLLAYRRAKLRGAGPGQAVAIVGVFLGVAGLFLSGLVSLGLVPSFQPVRELTLDESLRVKMQAAVKLIQVHAGENGGRYPSDEATLRFLVVDEGLVPPGQEYIYFTGHHLDADGIEPVICSPAEEKKGGGHVAFTDRRVEFLDRAEYERVVSPYRSRMMRVASDARQSVGPGRETGETETDPPSERRSDGEEKHRPKR